MTTLCLSDYTCESVCAICGRSHDQPVRFGRVCLHTCHDDFRDAQQLTDARVMRRSIFHHIQDATA